MEKYDSYRPSGIQWMTEIPSHWEVSKVRTHFRPRTDKVSEKDFAPLSVSKMGIVPQLEDVAISQQEGNTRKLVRKGDFVVNSRSDRKGSCGVSPLDGSVSLINIVLEPCGIEHQYVHYLFRMNDWIEDFYRYGRGIVADLWTTNYQQMKNMLMPVPPLPEQKAIVDYLDRETQKIDSFIDAKEKELALLDELKQAEIANAVTHGLNPDAPMKPSGISWLGDIPAHWDVKRMSTQFIGKVDANSDFYYKRAFKFNYGALVPKNEVGTDEEYKDTYVKYTVLKQGDIVLNGLNLNYDFVSQRVAICREPGIITSAYVVCRPRPSVYADYFCYLFKGMDAQKLFHGMGTGIRLTLSFEELKKQLLPIPPVDEQKAIVDYIEHKCDTINCLSSNIEQEIVHLKEYKQRLIADAVTGQIKVC